MSCVPIVFSVSIGQGHNQAARALKKELDAQGFANVEVIDTLHWLNPLLHHSVSMSYWWILRYRPSLWGKLFYKSYQSNKMLRSYEKTIRIFLGRVEQFIEEKQPPFIISTHPWATWLVALAKEKRGWEVPLYSVITDFQLHPAYVHKQVTSYFTMDEAANQFAQIYGESPSKFHQTGIPFPSNPPNHLESHTFRLRQNIPKHHAVVLIAGGGFGYSSYQTILIELEKVAKPLTILCMTGHNVSAQKKIQTIASKHDVRIVSFTDQFVSYLAISDIMITKAGGLTLSEALACEIPLILYEPIPGHEEQNAQVAVKWGMALRAYERNQISAQVELILSNQMVKERMILAARQHKKPNAVEEIVKKIIILQELLSASVSRAGVVSKG
ncbi:glycosyltransferase [bacterium LRH843]|nr:glycosyltransferase [bacterium LRH843]